MTRLLNCLGIASVIAAIVIGLLQLDLPYTGRVAVISVRTRTLSEGSLPELPSLLRAHRGCVDGSKCAICAIILSSALVMPAGPISGCCLVRPVPAGHLSSWCCQLQGLPRGGRKLAEGWSLPPNPANSASFRSNHQSMQLCWHAATMRMAFTGPHSKTTLSCGAGHSLGAHRADKKERYWARPAT